MNSRLQPIEQCIHARKDVKSVLADFLDRCRHVTRIGDQDVHPARPHRQERAGDEGKDVIERQRADDEGDEQRGSLSRPWHPRPRRLQARVPDA